jgi:hypothetical protein
MTQQSPAKDTRTARIRQSLLRKLRHTARLSRHSFRFAVFLGGAAFVALFSLAFAWLAELMLDWNQQLISAYWWSAILVVPGGFAALRWLTLRMAPQARGRRAAVVFRRSLRRCRCPSGRRSRCWCRCRNRSGKLC